MIVLAFSTTPVLFTGSMTNKPGPPKEQKLPEDLLDEPLRGESTQSLCVFVLQQQCI
jgi:hypothetical protein